MDRVPRSDSLRFDQEDLGGALLRSMVTASSLARPRHSPNLTRDGEEWYWRRLGVTTVLSEFLSAVLSLLRIDINQCQRHSYRIARTVTARDHQSETRRLLSELAAQTLRPTG